MHLFGTYQAPGKRSGKPVPVSGHEDGVVAGARIEIQRRERPCAFPTETSSETGPERAGKLGLQNGDPTDETGRDPATGRGVDAAFDLLGQPRRLDRSLLKCCCDGRSLPR